MQDLSFIGIGVMGRGMVANLLRGGYRVHVYSRRKGSAEGVIALGAQWHDTLAGCVQAADTIITMVGYPKDVEEVYFGKGGILESARPGATLIDMTTTEPGLARRIDKLAQERGMFALDAPVSGGDSGARNGTLSIMVGGEEAVMKRCLPVLGLMGKSIRLMGPAGAGQHTKMANQIVIAGTVSGVAEALAYARTNGLDQHKVLEAISGGAAGSWQLSNNGPKMVAGDDAPGFFIKHFIKDMDIAAREAAARGLDLPVLKLVLERYRTMEAAGWGELGTQALISTYQLRD